MLSHVSLFSAPCTVTCCAPLSMEFSRQEEWRRLPILLQRIIPTQGPSLHLLYLLYWQVDYLPQHHPGSLGNYFFKAPSPSIVDIHSYCELGLQHTRKCRLPRWLSGKESACNAGVTGSIPGLERSPGGGYGNLLQYSCWHNPKNKY